MAHIIAKSEKDPRGNESLSSCRNSYENLILLCANHHIEVDQNPKFYTVEKLHQIKSEHEENVNSIFNSLREREEDISFLRIFMRYVPFTKLQYFVEYLPISVNLDLSDIGDIFDALCKDNPHLYPLQDTILQSYFNEYIESYYELWSVITGETYVDGRLQSNFSQANDQGYMSMEKRYDQGYMGMEKRYLSYEEIIKLNEKLKKLKSNLIKAHLELIEYLRNYYKEIDLNSYEPVKI